MIYDIGLYKREPRVVLEQWFLTFTNPWNTYGNLKALAEHQIFAESQK